MRFDWPYFTLVKTVLGNQLQDDEGTICFPEMEFVDVAEAEHWLEVHDIRGSVQAAQ